MFKWPSTLPVMLHPSVAFPWTSDVWLSGHAFAVLPSLATIEPKVYVGATLSNLIPIFVDLTKLLDRIATALAGVPPSAIEP